jgi:hypothetical protein
MLTINPSSKFYFQNGASLIANGNLVANGSSSSTPITFDFISPNSTTQNGIKYNSSSSGSLSYCKILNAYNGVYENSVSVNITNSAISYCTYGIYLYSSSPTINSCNIHDNGTNIYLISSTPTIRNNYITNGSIGLNCSTSSFPILTSGYNNISNNTTGIFCSNNASPNIGNSTVDGNNNLTNTNQNVYNMSTSGVYAVKNWWGTTNTSNLLISGTGSVVYAPICTVSVSTTTPPLSKTSSELYVTQGNDIPLLPILNQAMQYIASNNPNLAKTICQTLINTFPDYTVSFNALNLLKDIYVASNKDSAKSVFQSLFNNNTKKKLYAMAGLILSDLDKDNKLQHLNDVIDKYAQDSVVELALFDKFVYYYFDKNDKVNACAMSTQLDNSFPLGVEAIEAHQILCDTAYLKMDLTKQQTLQQSTVQQTPTEYALSNNYPNPFNPTTVIEYQLPKNGFVSLKVYDILGRVVRTLVNESKTSGTYSVSFDASKLASGVYIYQLRVNAGGTNNIVLTKKMQLLK